MMRRYFMRDGHIEAVEELPGLADEEAIAKAHALFSERRLRIMGSRARAYPASRAGHRTQPWRLAASKDLETRCRLGSSRRQPISTPQAGVQGLS